MTRRDLNRLVAKAAGTAAGSAFLQSWSAEKRAVCTFRTSIMFPRDDPKKNVLNSFCQTHDIRNIPVFGGSCFVTTGDKHPTLTMLALTARGCDHLIDSVKRNEI